MAWEFGIRSKCDLFVTAVATPPEGEEFAFSINGEVNGNNVITPHVSAQIEGESYVTYSGHPQIQYTGFTYICPLAGEKLQYPAGLALSEAGPGLVYLCATARDGKKLDFDVFEGNHSYSTVVPSTYILVAKGTIDVNGTVLNQWDIAHKATPGEVALTSVSPDAIVFYIWERQ
jgi:hypothetical protein